MGTGKPKAGGTEKAGRRAAYRRGRRAESRALLLLRLKGYRLLARDFKRPVGEIDLILRRGRCIVLVEVKQRASLDQAAWAITGRQRQRIQRAALTFLQENPRFHRFDLRFDAVLLQPGHWPRHIVDAWRP